MKRNTTTIKQMVKTAFNGDYREAGRTIRQIGEGVEFERAKKMLKDNGNKIPYHRWYKQEKYNYLAYGLEKGKVTGYLKQECRTRGAGGRREYTYYRMYETGVIVYINVTMCKVGIIQGLTTPHIQVSNKREFDAAYKKFMKMIN